MSKNKKASVEKGFIEENKTRIFIALFSIIAILVVAIIICVGIYNKKLESVKLPFVPPEFDASAVEGNPSTLGIGEKEGYGIIADPNRLIYSVGLCGIFDVNETDVEGVYEADVYFYNPPTNNVWLKLRVYGDDPKTDIVAETGLIKPGEYIKTITFRRDRIDGEKLTAKVMSYVPEEYTSAGSCSLEPLVVSPIKKGCTSSLSASSALVALAMVACIPLGTKKKKK